MGENIVEVEELVKSYGSVWAVRGISFSVKRGSLFSFLGENGAGKSTTIKSILGLVNPDGGKIQVFGKDAAALSKKEKNAIGAVLGENCLPENLTLRDVSAVMRLIFAGWNEQSFFAYAEKFALPEDKKIRNFSRGMQQKAALAVALSHGAELLVLDEPTSGLDPVARDEILGFLYDFMQEERRSVLISSHIVTDLEKLCDYIVFIHGGKIVFAEEKDALRERYGIFRGSAEQVAALGKDAVAAYIRGDFGLSALVDRQKAGAGVALDRAGLEDIMLYYARGERV